MASPSRVQRVSDEIQKALTSALQRKVRDERLKWLTITAVEVTHDLSHAKVFFSSLHPDPLETPQKLTEALTRAKGFLRTYVAQQLTLRIAPNLQFIHDNSIAQGQEMNKLIQAAREQDKQFIQPDEDEPKAPPFIDDNTKLN